MSYNGYNRNNGGNRGYGNGGGQTRGYNGGGQGGYNRGNQGGYNRPSGGGGGAPRAQNGEAKEGKYLRITGLFRKENQYGEYFGGFDQDGFYWMVTPNLNGGNNQPEFFLQRAREARPRQDGGQRQGGYGNGGGNGGGYSQRQGGNGGGGYQGAQGGDEGDQSAADNG